MSVRYAVVDMETTSTNKETGKIIQFACSFLYEGKIETTFNTYINPEERIDENIQNLTGITQSMVNDAPIFEDIAGYLYSLLQNCVFVAHNVNFDYDFLSYAFQKQGLPPLTLKAIDTVGLAQCLLPTMESYRLSDLTKQLALTHDHPHRADSDAEATALLLCYLNQVAETLPQPLLKQLVALGDALAKDTNEWLIEQYKKSKQEQRYLPKEMTVIAGIVLQRPQWENPSFSAEHVMLREQQEYLASWIKDQNAHELLVEAETGSGKTLAYMMGYHGRFDCHHPLVIATSTQVLQEQVITQTLPLFNRLTNESHHAVLLKSSHHYIDLTRFAQTLNEAQPAIVQQLQMRLLVWLSQTKTGDLNELNMTAKQHPYWQHIRHRGLTYVSKKSPFYHVDFLYRREEERQHSDIYVMNHRYLLKHPPKHASFIIVDEAHHFGVTWQEQQRHSLHFSLFTHIKKQLLSPATLLFSKDNQKKWGRLSEQLTYAFETLAHEAKTLKEWIHSYYDSHDDKVILYDPMIMAPLYDTLISFDGVLNETQTLIQQAIMRLDDAENKKADRLYWQYQLTELNNQLIDWQRFFAAYPDDLNELQWKNQYLSLQHLPSPLPSFAQTQWVQHVRQWLFISGTLFVDGKSELATRLPLTNPSSLTVPAMFDYKTQVNAFVMSDGNPFYDPEALSQLLGEVYDLKGKVMCLMTSYDRLSEVKAALNEAIPVFSFSPFGNKAKVVRQFNEASHGILLGVGTMWEGMDINASCLVIEKLPFIVPDSHESFLLEKTTPGGVSFKEQLLPLMILRLRQGVGRLLRDINQKGEIIITDSRLCYQWYGTLVMKALPFSLESVTEEKLISTMRKDVFK